MDPNEIKELEEKIIEKLKQVYDPEIPVNIYEIGLIYEFNISDNYEVKVLMTLTSPTCPVADSLVEDVKNKIAEVDKLQNVDVELTFDPPWDMGMMSLEAKIELGFA
ncbi:iron-sulfur cluster assembly protein [Bacteroidota bacterium]